MGNGLKPQRWDEGIRVGTRTSHSTSDKGSRNRPTEPTYTLHQNLGPHPIPRQTFFLNHTPSPHPSPDRRILQDLQPGEGPNRRFTIQ